MSSHPRARNTSHPPPKNIHYSFISRSQLTNSFPSSRSSHMSCLKSCFAFPSEHEAPLLPDYPSFRSFWHESARYWLYVSFESAIALVGTIRPRSSAQLSSKVSLPSVLLSIPPFLHILGVKAGYVLIGNIIDYILVTVNHHLTDVPLFRQILIRFFQFIQLESFLINDRFQPTRCNRSVHVFKLSS